MNPPPATPDLAQRRATGRPLAATATLFATLGVAAGAWGAHVPSVKARYGLDEAQLSGLLFAAAAGAVLALFVAGRLVARLGVRRCVQLAGLGLAIALAGALHAPGPPGRVGLAGLPGLVGLMLLLGASMGVFDVAINAEGTALEQLARRKVMARLHALFSVGGMVGAGLAAAMFAARWSAALQMGLLALAVAAGALLAAPGLLDEHPPDEPPAAGQRLPMLRGVVWLLGLLTLAGMVAEGAMYDWSVLYLAQELQQPPATAALGFAVFSGAMAAARFGADAARARWTEGTLLAAGAALAALAMALVLLAGHPALAFVGYALVGIGLAPAVPILYTAATRIPGVPRAAAIAAVSSIGYAGFMIGPPLIGALAKAMSLTAALGVVVLAGALLALFGRRIP
jgi:fucose permease